MSLDLVSRSVKQQEEDTQDSSTMESKVRQGRRPQDKRELEKSRGVGWTLGLFWLARLVDQVGIFRSLDRVGDTPGSLAVEPSRCVMDFRGFKMADRLP